MTCVREVIECLAVLCRYDYSGYGQSTGKVRFLDFCFMFGL